jgi:hypothetical protein
METFLRLPAGKLAHLADLQRQEPLKRKLAAPPAPLFQEVRELILRKCVSGKRHAIGAIFEREPFGALERLVGEKLLDVVQRMAREIEDETWLRRSPGSAAAATSNCAWLRSSSWSWTSSTSRRKTASRFSIP